MRDMLSSELLQSTILGESKKALKRRIKRVAGYQYNYQALRTAQTERTRVQSQASYMAAKEAQSMGLKKKRLHIFLKQCIIKKKKN